MKEGCRFVNQLEHHVFSTQTDIDKHPQRDIIFLARKNAISTKKLKLFMGGFMYPKLQNKVSFRKYVKANIMSYRMVKSDQYETVPDYKEGSIESNFDFLCLACGNWKHFRCSLDRRKIFSAIYETDKRRVALLTPESNITRR